MAAPSPPSARVRAKGRATSREGGARSGLRGGAGRFGRAVGPLPCTSIVGLVAEFARVGVKRRSHPPVAVGACRGCSLDRLTPTPAGFELPDKRREPEDPEVARRFLGAKLVSRCGIAPCGARNGTEKPKVRRENEKAGLPAGKGAPGQGSWWPRTPRSEASAPFAAHPSLGWSHGSPVSASSAGRTCLSRSVRVAVCSLDRLTPTPVGSHLG
jgi:hypothetical protein